MQSTYRWYAVRLPDNYMDAEVLSKRLLKSREADTWFHFDGDANFLFFRRSEFWVDQYDQRGNIIAQRIEGVSATRFSIVVSPRVTLIRVANPGRNMQHLMSAIERAVGYGFACKPLVLGNWQESSVIRRSDVSKLVSLKVTNVAVGPDCVGRMEFASKEGMLPESIPMLRNVSFKFEHVKYELIYRGVRGFFAASSTGLVRVGGSLGEFILAMIERDMIKTAERRN